MFDACRATALTAFAVTVILALTITAVVVVARPQHPRRHQHGSGGVRHSRGGDGRGQTRVTEDAFLEHMSRVRRFLCREARPRSIAVSDLVSEKDDEDSWKPAVGEVVFPPVTVLHRCENTSGCCLQGDNFSCSPVEMEIVRLVFQVSVVVSGSNNNNNDESEDGTSNQSQHHQTAHETRQETIYAMNHTRCACMEAELPK